MIPRHTQYESMPAYETRDGSLIRELMHPEHHGVRNQSLAEAIVAPGQGTHLHRHHASEELYHITQGEGWMTLGDAQFKVGVGDTISIEPGTAHCIENRGSQELKILCSCSPAYSHDDTELLEV
ncbi:MAG: cupin domain-containing protein [Gammaproteobacteria bacterium]|nr:cupin domain-containing protein [Gammaproteobacteria bacterium]